ncbi:MAG: hypothetical protein QOF98_1102, partial [Streptomyces sp.]|nr:hypothetical protein [Streptomyces sp.]
PPSFRLITTSCGASAMFVNGISAKLPRVGASTNAATAAPTTRPPTHTTTGTPTAPAAAKDETCARRIPIPQPQSSGSPSTPRHDTGADGGEGVP